MSVALEHPHAPTVRLDASELAAIYRRHHRMVRWLVRGRGIAEHAVDDVTQDVFVAIHRRWTAQTTGGQSDDLRRWIVGVTASVCHTHRRAHAREHQRRLQLLPPPSPPTPEDGLDARRALERLAVALAELAPAQRDVFVLVEIDGASVPQVAHALGIGLATAHSRLRLARARLLRAVGLDAAMIALARAADRDDPRQTRAVLARVGMALPWLGGRISLASMPVLGLGLGLVVAIAGSFASRGTPDAPPRAPTLVAPAPREIVPASAPALASIPPPPRTSSSPDPQRAAKRPQPSRPAAAPDDDDALAREAALLRAAAGRLDAGDRSGARDLLDEHARRFPSGSLGDERERLRAAL